MNFGAPRLDVREPRISKATSARVRASFARRGVYLRGTHWLVVSPGSWRLELADGLVVRDSGSMKRLDMAVARLGGEKLNGLSIDTRTGAAILYFDLGARIVIRARPDDSGEFSLWSLSNPTRVVEIYADGSYCHGSVSRSLEARLPLAAHGEPLLAIARTPKLARTILGLLPVAAV